MKRRYERTTEVGYGEVLVPETEEDMDEIDQRWQRGEVNASASFGDRRAEVAKTAQNYLRWEEALGSKYAPQGR